MLVDDDVRITLGFGDQPQAAIKTRQPFECAVAMDECDHDASCESSVSCSNRSVKR